MAFELKGNMLLNVVGARAKARQSTLQFSINPVDRGTSETVYGILKNKPKYSIEANYDRLINMDDNFAMLNKIGGAFGGIQVGMTKEWTQQVFKGGSYLNIALTARIIQDEFVPDVVWETKKLISLCNPRNLFTADESVKRLEEKDKEKPKVAPSLLTTPPTEAHGKTATQAAINVKDFVGGLVTNFAGSAPPKCYLTISNYFRMGGFFVKSVAFEFSHEQSFGGPLYSDVDIELVQSQIVRDTEIKGAFEHQNGFSNGR